MDNDEDVVDTETYFRLKNVIEILTHSGLKTLDEKLFKEVKKICRLSNAATRKTYSLILYQLKKNHSEIRYIAFQMCIELFKRSALFRTLLIKDLPLIFELTAETNLKKKMPPPRTVAEMLDTLALSTIKKWHDEYGETFKELKVAFYYLKHFKKVNFETMLANNEMDEHRKKREKILKEEKMKRLIQEIDNNESEIENTVMALTNCLSLLIPSPENFFINEDRADSDITYENFKTQHTLDHQEILDPHSNTLDLKHFGITSNYGIVVNQNLNGNKIKVMKTEENSSIIQNAEDNVKLIKNRFLPLIKKWNKACITCSSDSGTTIQRILKIKEKMENIIKKFDELNIHDNCDNNKKSDSSDDDDDDFVEVTKEDYENDAPKLEYFDIISRNPAPHCKKKESEWNISVGEDGDPTSALSTIKRLQATDESTPILTTGASTSGSNCLEDGHTSKNMSRKDRLLACAPKLPFDVDLYHWEDQNLTAPTLLSVKMDNPKFWGVTSIDDMDEIPNPEGLAALRTRVIEFSGKFEPVKWSCRAPLPNGKLCPRKDRFKCPFHGKIVPRDENGVWKDGTSAESDKNKMHCDWQDPELLEDIKNATGIDLMMPEKKKRSKNKNVSKTHKIMKTSSSTLREIETRKFPGLSDTFGKQNNSCKGIAKKIFKRSALNKVAETMNKIDFVRHRDKFGDQFNYVYGT